VCAFSGKGICPVAAFVIEVLHKEQEIACARAVGVLTESGLQSS